MAKKINILHLLSLSKIGGTELMVYSLIKNLDRERFNNQVCFLEKKGPLTYYYQRLGIKTHHLNFSKRNFLISLIKLFLLLKRDKFDMLNIYGLRAHVIGRVVGRLAGVRVIIGGLHSQISSDRGGGLVRYAGLYLDKLTFPLLTAYIANNKTSIDYMAENGFDTGKIKYIPNGIELDEFRKPTDKLKIYKSLPFEFDDRSVIITCVANLRPLKNHRMLLEAMTTLLKENLNFKLLFVGDGETSPKLLKYINQHNLNACVFLLGVRDDVAEILSISDIFVLTSLWEGMPGAIMEAMAAGLPVVATDVGDVKELVEDGKTGFLVKVGDVNALTGYIKRLVEDKDLRERMGREGSRKIDNYPLEKKVAQTEEFYLDIVKRFGI